MESQQRTYLKGEKVKLHLVQPHIKCSGRDDVTCYYRGKVVWTYDMNFIIINFKYKGQIIEEAYDLLLDEWLVSDGTDPSVYLSIKDIKLKKQK